MFNNSSIESFSSAISHPASIISSDNISQKYDYKYIIILCIILYIIYNIYNNTLNINSLNINSLNINQ